MKREMAEVLALKALAWLIASEELMPVFMGSTGVSVEELRARAQEPEFLGSVLDFLLINDAWITGFCDAETLGYDAPMRARSALPGGDLPNWT